MFRKNEAAFTEWSEENVRLCAKRQAEILDNAAKMLAPGGRMVYSTCTFSPEENEENIYRFLLKHRDFHVPEPSLAGGMENGRSEFVDRKSCEDALNFEISPDDASRALDETGRSVRLWPHKVEGEGHFLCVLQRDGTNTGGNTHYAPGGGITPAKKEQIKAFLDFQNNFLKNRFGNEKDADYRGDFLMFGDQLYLCPLFTPAIKGLKVLRPGMHLGTNIKDRFEPSHALALLLDKDKVRLSYDISSEDLMMRQYLNGQALRPGQKQECISGEKGWCLITCDGYSLGWCKLAGGVLKNHYPKGLRINY